MKAKDKAATLWECPPEMLNTKAAESVMWGMEHLRDESPEVITGRDLAHAYVLLARPEAFVYTHAAPITPALKKLIESGTAWAADCVAAVLQIPHQASWIELGANQQYTDRLRKFQIDACRKFSQLGDPSFTPGDAANLLKALEAGRTLDALRTLHGPAAPAGMPSRKAAPAAAAVRVPAQAAAPAALTPQPAATGPTVASRLAVFDHEAATLIAPWLNGSPHGDPSGFARMLRKLTDRWNGDPAVASVRPLLPKLCQLVTPKQLTTSLKWGNASGRCMELLLRTMLEQQSRQARSGKFTAAQCVEALCAIPKEPAWTASVPRLHEALSKHEEDAARAQHKTEVQLLQRFLADACARLGALGDPSFTPLQALDRVVTLLVARDLTELQHLPPLAAARDLGDGAKADDLAAAMVSVKGGRRDTKQFAAAMHSVAKPAAGALMDGDDEGVAAHNAKHWLLKLGQALSKNGTPSDAVFAGVMDLIGSVGSMSLSYAEIMDLRADFCVQLGPALTERQYAEGIRLIELSGSRAAYMYFPYTPKDKTIASTQEVLAARIKVLAGYKAVGS